LNPASTASTPAKTAAEICTRFELDAQAKPLLRDGIAPPEFVAALVQRGLYAAAIDFVAHGLVPRQAVWWGCLCLQHALGERLQPTDKAAASAAVRWVMQPNEENRALAESASKPADPLSPAAALALAASQTAGQPFVFAKSVARAVKLASIKTEPANIAKRQRSYVELAVEVAHGNFV
jgi:hypothetical protein